MLSSSDWTFIYVLFTAVSLLSHGYRLNQPQIPLKAIKSNTQQRLNSVRNIIYSHQLQKTDVEMESRRRMALQLSGSDSMILSAMDYAAEVIQNTGSKEDYGPVFRAGLFLFASGIISTFIAAFIITKSNSWDGLVDELERGKEAKLDNYDDFSAKENVGTDKSKELYVDEMFKKIEGRSNESKPKDLDILDGIDI